MSNMKEEQHSLGTLQEQILLALASKGPQTMNQVKEFLKKDYKAVHDSFQTLLKKELLREIDVKEYRNRKFKIYWLSSDSVMLAMVHGANFTILKEHLEKIDGKSEETDMFFEIAGTIPRDKLGDIFRMFKATKEGRFILRSIPLNENEIKALGKVILRYPFARKAMRSMGKMVQKMIDETE